MYFRIMVVFFAKWWYHENHNKALPLKFSQGVGQLMSSGPVAQTALPVRIMSIMSPLLYRSSWRSQKIFVSSGVARVIWLTKEISNLAVLSLKTRKNFNEPIKTIFHRKTVVLKHGVLQIYLLLLLKKSSIFFKYYRKSRI